MDRKLYILPSLSPHCGLLFFPLYTLDNPFCLFLFLHIQLLDISHGEYRKVRTISSQSSSLVLGAELQELQLLSYGGHLVLLSVTGIWYQKS